SGREVAASGGLARVVAAESVHEASPQRGGVPLWAEPPEEPVGPEVAKAGERLLHALAHGDPAALGDTIQALAGALVREAAPGARLVMGGAPHPSEGAAVEPVVALCRLGRRTR
ncbi:MAG: hypothetical protein AB1609_00200, partial [Bacillota bacterium]